MNAFDADVLIYAVQDGHPLGGRVLPLFEVKRGKLAGLGSLLLLPEVLSRPLRQDQQPEVRALKRLLSRLELLPLDAATARLAAALGAGYSLRAADAVHLATAVNAGADRFLTNNQRDFPKSISEIEIVYPEDLLPV